MENQLESNNRLRQLSRKEVELHNTKESKWIIVQNKVYDITTFSKRHPGGAKILSHAAGEDSTVGLI